VKTMVCCAGAPETGTDPELGAAEYPVTEPTEKAYEPFASENPMVPELEDRATPASVTVHEVPDDRVDWLNVTG
jgi:hypothetical protein